MTAMPEAIPSKIAFLIQGPTAPSTRIRILNLLPHFRKAGFETVVETYPNSFGGWRRTAPKLRGAEILVIQKRLPSLIEAALLRWRFKRLVFDFDDSVWLRNREGDAKPSAKLMRRFANLMKRTDLAICGNPILEARVRAISPGTRTMIIPSSVPAPDENILSEANTILQVGWVGTAINLPYLIGIEQALVETHARIPFELVVICSEPPRFANFSRFRFIEWSEQTEYEAIRRFDVGIMPLADNEHSRGKCAYKALQYMRCGVPVIASDVGINREWIAGLGAGMVVKDGGWRDALVTILGDSTIREQFGKAGIVAIQDGFRTEDVARQSIAAFRELLSKPN